MPDFLQEQIKKRPEGCHIEKKCTKVRKFFSFFPFLAIITLFSLHRAFYVLFARPQVSFEKVYVPRPDGLYGVSYFEHKKLKRQLRLFSLSTPLIIACAVAVVFSVTQLLFPVSSVQEATAQIPVPVRIFTVNSASDLGDNSIGDGLCWTGNWLRGRPPQRECTLRAAIEEANATGAGADVQINIAINDTTSVGSITGNPLPALQKSGTVIAATPLIRGPFIINGSSAPFSNGLEIDAAGCFVNGGIDRNIRIVNFQGLPGIPGSVTGYGIYVKQGPLDIYGVELGTADGTTAAGNWVGGVRIGDDFIGYLQDVQITNSVISGNGTPGTAAAGVDQSKNSDLLTLTNNHIGTTEDGNSILSNTGHGVHLRGDFNVIGGPDAKDRNVISGNGSVGALPYSNVYLDEGADDTTVENNYIGIGRNGTAAIPGGYAGVYIYPRTYNNDIFSNTIGNQDQIGIYAASDNKFNTTNVDIIDNRVGFDDTGGDAPNPYAALLLNLDTSTVSNNVFSNSSQYGLYIHSYGTTAKDVHAYGNKIGTDKNGLVARPNTTGMVINNCVDCRVGGPNPGEQNIISGNTNIGFETQASAVNLTVQNNLIGLDADGKHAIPNGSGAMVGSCTNCHFGGPGAKEGNYVSGNTQWGFLTVNSPDVVVDSNYFGYQTDKTSPLPNGTINIGIGERSDRGVATSNRAYGGEYGVFVATAVGGGLPKAEDVQVVKNAFYGQSKSGVYVEEASGTTIKDGNSFSVTTDHAINILNSDNITIGKATIDNSAGTEAIKVNSSTDVTVRDSDISGGGTGIRVENGCDTVTLQRNSANDGDNGITTEGSTNVTIDDNTTNSNLYYGIYGENGLTGTVSNNTVEENGLTGMQFDGVGAMTIEENTIQNTPDEALKIGDNTDPITVEDNTIRNNDGTGIHLVRTLDVMLNNNTVDDNADGISIAESDGTVISNNTIINNTDEGIDLTKSDTNISIISNYIGTNASLALGLTNAGHAVEVSNGSTDVTIGGNDLDFNYIVPAEGMAGVRVTEDTTLRVLISKNVFLGNDQAKFIQLRAGANEGIGKPTITELVDSTVSGTDGVAGGRVEVYVDGEYKAEDTSIPVSGDWSVFISGLEGASILQPAGAGSSVQLSTGQILGAINIDASNNTSEFSEEYVVQEEEPEEPECGNGVVETGEECDDGNTTDGDGCSSICTVEEDDGDDGFSISVSVDKDHESAEITVKTTDKTTVTLKYGTDPGNLDQTATSDTLSKSHLIAIGGLNPNTKYYYDVVAKNEADETEDAEGNFTTDPFAVAYLRQSVYLNGLRVTDPDERMYIDPDDGANFLVQDVNPNHELQLSIREEETGVETKKPYKAPVDAEVTASFDVEKDVDYEGYGKARLKEDHAQTVKEKIATFTPTSPAPAITSLTGTFTVTTKPQLLQFEGLAPAGKDSQFRFRNFRTGEIVAVCNTNQTGLCELPFALAIGEYDVLFETLNGSPSAPDFHRLVVTPPIDNYVLNVDDRNGAYYKRITTYNNFRIIGIGPGNTNGHLSIDGRPMGVVTWDSDITWHFDMSHANAGITQGADHLIEVHFRDNDTGQITGPRVWYPYKYAHPVVVPIFDLAERYRLNSGPAIDVTGGAHNALYIFKDNQMVWNTVFGQYDGTPQGGAQFPLPTDALGDQIISMYAEDSIGLRSPYQYGEYNVYQPSSVLPPLPPAEDEEEAAEEEEGGYGGGEEEEGGEGPVVDEEEIDDDAIGSDDIVDGGEEPAGEPTEEPAEGEEPGTGAGGEELTEEEQESLTQLEESLLITSISELTEDATTVKITGRAQPGSEVKLDFCVDEIVEVTTVTANEEGVWEVEVDREVLRYGKHSVLASASIGDLVTDHKLMGEFVNDTISRFSNTFLLLIINLIVFLVISLIAIYLIWRRRMLDNAEQIRKPAILQIVAFGIAAAALAVFIVYSLLPTGAKQIYYDSILDLPDLRVERVNGVDVKQDMLPVAFTENETVVLEGASIAGSTVRISVCSGIISYETTVDDSGRWRLELPVAEIPNKDVAYSMEVVKDGERVVPATKIAQIQVEDEARVPNWLLVLLLVALLVIADKFEWDILKRRSLNRLTKDQGQFKELPEEPLLQKPTAEVEQMLKERYQRRQPEGRQPTGEQPKISQQQTPPEDDSTHSVLGV